MNLNPDGPHSPDRTRKVGTLLDDCSRYLTYATMGEKRGLDYPADVYSLVADVYSATGRFPQMCDQLTRFLRVQVTRPGLYDARAGDPARAVAHAIEHLTEAARYAGYLTRALQAVQADISGLGVRETNGG